MSNVAPWMACLPARLFTDLSIATTEAATIMASATPTIQIGDIMPTARKKKVSDSASDIFLLTLLIDKSGSMYDLIHETINGVNKYLDGQQSQPGDTLVTLIQFDNEYEIMCSGVAIESAPRLDVMNYQPRGSTALYDATARTIAEIDTTVAKSNIKPHVLLVIVTDGLENASQEYALDDNGQQRIFDLVNARQDAGWSVVYMGANADAKKTGATLGVHTNNSITYAGTGASVKGSYDMLADATMAYRGAATASASPTATTTFFSSIGVVGVDSEGNATKDDDDGGKGGGKLAGPKGKLP